MSLKCSTLAAAVFLAACGEPTQPLPLDHVGEPGHPAVSFVSPDLVAAWADEAEWLLPAVGASLNEEPLRVALWIVRDRAPADQTAYAARAQHARTLFESYQWKQGDAVDLADVGAIELLMTSMHETLTAAPPAVVTNDRRP